jgi:hypothetical protein
MPVTDPVMQAMQQPQVDQQRHQAAMQAIIMARNGQQTVPSQPYGVMRHPEDFAPPQPVGVMAPPPQQPGMDPLQEEYLARLDASQRENAERDRLADMVRNEMGLKPLPEFGDENMHSITRSAMQAGYAMSALGLNPDGSARKGGSDSGDLEKLSATERQELQSLGDSISLVDEAMSTIPESREMFGGGGLEKDIHRMARYVGYEGYDVPDRQNLDSDLSALAARFQRAISGAQMTEQEYKRFQEFLPNATKPYDVAMRDLKKLSSMLREQLQRRQKTLIGAGYNVPDVYSEMRAAAKDPDIIEIDE